MVPDATRTIRCAIYARKSTDIKLDVDFSSIDSQLQICSSYIASQEHRGWVQLNQSYEDAGWSGSNVDRPGMQAMISDLKARKIDVIVVYKMDRLTRSLSDFIQLVGMLDRLGVTFVSVTQAFDTSDPMGRMVMNIILTFAQFERELIGDRVRDKIRTMRSRGLWTGGTAPFGYDLVDKKLLINIAQSEIVKKIFRSLVSHRNFADMKREIIYSGENITQNGRNFSSILAGQRLSNSGLHKLVANPVYIGKILCDGKLVEGQHEPIISQELWDEAQDVRDQRKAIRYREEAGDSLLRGILFDSHGRRMLTASERKCGRRYRYYFSNYAVWSEKLEIDRLRIRADKAEYLITSALRNFLNNRSNIIQCLHLMHLDNEIVENLVSRSKRLPEWYDLIGPSELRLFFLDVIERCVAFSDHIMIHLRCDAILRLLEMGGVLSADYQRLSWSRNTPIMRIRVAAIISNASRHLPVPLEPAKGIGAFRPRKSLTSLLVDARRAQDLAFCERKLSLPELGCKMGVSGGVFARLLRLNYLAPDIIASIIDGRQPEGLTRRKLLYAALPIDWGLQRQLLGFAIRPDHELNSIRAARQNRSNLPQMATREKPVDF